LVKNHVKAPTTRVIAPTHGLMKRITEPNSLPTFISTGPIFQNALNTVPTTPPSFAKIGLADLAIPIRLSSPLPRLAPLNAPATPLTAPPKVPNVEAAVPTGPATALSPLKPKKAITIFSTTPGLFSVKSRSEERRVGKE